MNVQHDTIEVHPAPAPAPAPPPPPPPPPDPNQVKGDPTPPQKKKVKRSLREKLIHQIFLWSRINYFKLHFLYILGIGFLGAIVIVAAENRRSGLNFMDSLFMSFACACETGLTTVDIAKWSAFAQVVLLIVIQLGSIVMLSLPIVLVRRSHMRHAFRGEKTVVRTKSSDKGSAVLTSSTTMQKVVAQNIEYRSLGKLLFLIPLYWFSIQFFGFIILGSYLHYNQTAAQIVSDNGSNGWYWGFFTACSAFNNAGLTLFEDNLVPFQRDRLVLLILSVLIACGNTLYPVFLRWIVWFCSKLSRDKEPYQNLLANPRSYFTHLFPAKQTWIIFASWIGITIVQMIFFLGFDGDNKQLNIRNTADLFLASFFQSVAIRTAGFNIVAVAALSHALLILYLLMMYMSAYPFIVSLRETAVNSRYLVGDLGHSRRKRTQAVVKDLLIRDILVLYVATLLISMIEDNRFNVDNFTVFHVLFEVVSAYGTVGLSMGYPGRPYSFSGILGTGSQLVMIAIMILGRHRGLPESVDSAVSSKEFAPLERLLKRDIEDYTEEIDESEMEEHYDYNDHKHDDTETHDETDTQHDDPIDMEMQE